MNAKADLLIRRHPLQRLSSPSRGVSSIVHALGLSTFAAAFKHLVDVPNPANESFGWHFQYLTIIGLTLATITFAFGSLADITTSSRIFNVKNTLSMCSAPLEVLISLLYWSLRLIDRRLVMPNWMEMDLWADISLHAAPSILLVLDLLFLSPPWSITILPAIGLSGAIAFAYWFWVELCYSRNGWYPYPLFEMLSLPQRVMVFAGSALVMSASTATLKWLYGRVNGYGVGDLRPRPGAVKG